MVKIGRFMEILLERESDEEYLHYRVKEDPTRPTLLHLAVERNFLHATKLLVEKYPSLVYVETEKAGYEREYLPVEKALMLYNDETAAYLILQMEPERWVTHTYISIYSFSSRKDQRSKLLTVSAERNYCVLAFGLLQV